MTFGDGDSEVFCCKFDETESFLACGYGDGFIRIYNLENGKLSYTLHGLTADEDQLAMPVTALQWRPESAIHKTRNIIAATYADGTLKHWHATSGKLLHQHRDNEENHLYCLDFNQ